MNFSLSKDILRRFILGKQGLWPGRHWSGEQGTDRALRESELIQVDPLNVVARSHDLALLSRVAGYRPEYLDQLLYRDHQFFDYGGAVFICPMDELPFWRPVMQRKVAEKRWVQFALHNPGALEMVRSEVKRRGPLGNRDFAGPSRTGSFRTGKISGLALYYLWLKGELMTHHRQNFERIFDLAENIVPSAFDRTSTVQEAERFLILKQISHLGLCRLKAFGGLLGRPLGREEAARWRDQLLESGEILAVSVEGQSEPWYLRAGDASLLDDLAAGRVPEPWHSVETTTGEEATFLAPLDIVSARGRSKSLFDFEYLWEVYKPAEKRRWGYYTLPVLFDDRLVARLDPKYDRVAKTLVIKGFWLENDQTGKDGRFADALGRGLVRLVQFLGVRLLDVAAVDPPILRSHIRKFARENHVRA